MRSPLRAMVLPDQESESVEGAVVKGQGVFNVAYLGAVGQLGLGQGDLIEIEEQLTHRFIYAGLFQHVLEEVVDDEGEVRDKREFPYPHLRFEKHGSHFESALEIPHARFDMASSPGVESLLAALVYLVVANIAQPGVDGLNLFGSFHLVYFALAWALDDDCPKPAGLIPPLFAVKLPMEAEQRGIALLHAKGLRLWIG